MSDETRWRFADNAAYGAASSGAAFFLWGAVAVGAVGANALPSWHPESSHTAAAYMVIGAVGVAAGLGRWRQARWWLLPTQLFWWLAGLAIVAFVGWCAYDVVRWAANASPTPPVRSLLFMCAVVTAASVLAVRGYLTFMRKLHQVGRNESAAISESRGSYRA